MQEQHDVLGWIEKTDALQQELEDAGEDKVKLQDIGHRISSIAHEIHHNLTLHPVVELQMMLKVNTDKGFSIEENMTPLTLERKIGYYHRAIESILNDPDFSKKLLPAVKQISEHLHAFAAELHAAERTNNAAVKEFLHHPITVDLPEHLTQHL